MKKYIFTIGGIIGFSVLTLVFMFSVRAFNAKNTHINIHKVKPGIECAVIVTTNGVAIDCWKDELDE